MDVLNAVTQCNEKVTAVEKEIEEFTNQVRIDFRSKIEPLFDKRHLELEKIEGFWGSAFVAVESPLMGLLNGTIDPKIVRALTDFRVKTSVRDGSICRCVSVTFRPNMFVKEGTFSRELDPSVNTLSLQPILWKPGTEKARTDSLFRFFSPECKDIEFLERALTEFDELFQNPLLAFE